LGAASNVGVSVKPAITRKLAFFPLLESGTRKNNVAQLLASISHQPNLTPEALKTAENTLLSYVQAEPSLVEMIGQTLWHTNLTVQQVASMVLLRSGRIGRLWLAQQLTEHPSQANGWIVDFLRHQFSL
jgi:hypothetical protein